jgi:tetratricopeptide (TPR) repeat protein
VLRGRRGSDPLVLAVAVSTIWMLHPLQTAAVTYVSRRADSLSGLFFLATLYCFARGASRRPSAEGPATGATWFWFGSSIACCLLGVATKEVVALAPIVAMLLDRTFLSGSVRAAWRARWRVHATMALTSWVLVAWLLAEAGNRGGTAGPGTEVSSWHYLLTQAEAIVRYLGLAVWPHPLVFDYGTTLVTNATAVAPQFVLLVGLVVLTCLALWRRPVAGFCGACFFLTLAPASSVVPVVTQTAAEHRMYLPLAALVALAVGALHRWIGWRVVPVAFAAAVALGFVTFDRNADYREALTLWGDTVAKRPENARARNSHGRALVAAGRLDEAVGQFARAAELAPDSAEIRSNLGGALLEAGRFADGLRELEMAVRLDPELAPARAGLAGALLQARRPAEAIPHFEAALALAPDLASTRARYALALVQAKRVDDAIAQYREAIRFDPGLAETHYNLGMIFAQQGRLPDALPCFQEAVRLRPDYTEARNNLGNALLLLDRAAEAIPHYESALRTRPEAMTLTNLGHALLRTGRRDEAIARYREALALRPGHIPALEGIERARALPGGG